MFFSLLEIKLKIMDHVEKSNLINDSTSFKKGHREGLWISGV